MKLIIDIDDNVFTRLFDNGVDTSSDDREAIDRAVRNGMPYERPQGDLISREVLKEVINYNQMYVNPKLAVDDVIKLIDNAPTVDTTEQEENAYNEGYAHGLETKKPQGEYTEEDIKQAIKENFDIGYEMAKNKFERPQGKWILTPDDFSSFKCSVCEKPNFWKDNFCPNCGADMGGDKNE